MVSELLSRGFRRSRARAAGFALVTAIGLSLLAPVAALAAPSIAGCPVFPADNVWNTDISSLPVHGQSGAWLGNMGGPGRQLHPDFGSSGDPSAPYGIPYIVVNGSHAKVSVTFQYAGESDRGPYPFGPDTPIEGGQNAGGDRHALMVDSSSCTLYELYNARYSSAGSTAGSGAVFNLRANGPLRPATWTSADAAGLPILPGLLRPEEVRAGVVNHAIRFTAQSTDRSFIWPARHQAGSATNAALPPMGARFRLKAGYDISHFHGPAQAVLNAMKRYGLILADNGSNWYFQGAADNSWDSTMISELKTVPAGAFDAVDESSLMIDPNSGQARQPGGAAGPASNRAATSSAPAASAPGTTAPATSPTGDATPLEQHEVALADPVVGSTGRAATATGGALAGQAPPWQLAVALAAGLLLAAGVGGAWLLRGRLQ
ncbi:MAG TPA: hypothetical protein VG329_09355 [Candidatus Dormibacteraeota bacterium]|nr:hypothetical protein [Candidatus Dormibacteraeota bacterium]